MRKEAAPTDHSRRQFSVGLFTALATVIGASNMAVARGGGGDARQDREEQQRRTKRKNAARTSSITQAQFMRGSRSKHFEYSQNLNYNVEGFSPEMSVELFRMGYSNLRRTNALLGKLMKVSRLQSRRDILRREVAQARKDFETGWGVSSQKQKRKIYLDAVTRWAGNPREGRLSAQ